MYINDYLSTNYVNKLLERALVYGNRMVEEPPLWEWEKQGRLLSMYGAVAGAEECLEYFEKATMRTLHTHQPFDHRQMIARFEAVKGGLKIVFDAVPFFRERNYQDYPPLEKEDIPSFKASVRGMEVLPLCGQGKAARTNFDATEVAYMMHDMIFIGLDHIIQLHHNLADDERMLAEKPEKRIQRWNLMMKDYMENDWVKDKQYFQKYMEEHIRQYGHDKASLTVFMNHFERHSTDEATQKMVARINRHYLEKDHPITFIFKARHELTSEDVKQHMYFICCWQLIMQEIELCDLRQPAVGAYNNLFKNRAAKELADLLAPVIAYHVDFKKDYHYAAYALAMKDTGLFQAQKPNGTLIIHYVKVMFNEQIDKSILSRHTKDSKDFKKIEDEYHLILSIINQALGREPMGENHFFQNQDKEFFDRLETLKKAL